MVRIIALLGLLLLSSTATAKAIVVLGDSLSAGYGMAVEQGWVALLQQRLNQQGTGYTLYNESISGDTSSGGVARINKALQSYQPEVLILELGANDGLRGLPPTMIKANLAEIIRRAQQAGSRVLLLSMRIPPNYGKRYVDMFYQLYPQLAEETGSVYVPFILQDVALLTELMQPDGLHPNAKAQPLIVEKIWSQLQPLLK